METLSYLHTPKDEPILYKTIPERVHDHYLETPSKEIFIQRFQDGTRKSLTLKNLYERSSKLAVHLVKNGIKKGDTIALIGSNSLDWIICELGVLIAGAICVHVLIGRKDAADAVDIIERANCVSIMIDPREHDEMICDQILKSLEIDSKGSKRFMILLNSYTNRPYLTLQTLLNSTIEGLDEFKMPPVFPEDHAVVFTTSGSTGQPKMIVHSHLSIGLNQHICQDTKKVKDSLYFSDRPFSWFGGSPLHSLPFGLTRVFIDTRITTTTGNSLFIWDVISSENCNIAQVLPCTLWDWMAVEDRRRFTGVFMLDSIVAGGQLVDKCIMESIGSFTRSIRIVYAGTESGVVSTRDVYTSTDERETGDVGKPEGGIEIRVVDPSGAVVGLQKTGSIQTRSSIQFKGYLGVSMFPKDVLTEDGWYNTGDIGKITNDRSLVFLGREKDIIKRGTKSILPGFIEDLVLTMSAIKEVVAVPVPDKRYHEEVCVCFTRNENSLVTSADVDSFCRDRLLQTNADDGFGYMPKYFLDFDTFPTLANGKLDRQTIKKQSLKRLELGQSI